MKEEIIRQNSSIDIKGRFCCNELRTIGSPQSLNSVNPHMMNPSVAASVRKEIYVKSYQDILFIESEQKKSVIHLLKKTICVSVPLYRILEVLPKETFVQTHRSFIVNLKNASSIDKSQNPWTISFFGSEQLAFVGRSFKDNIMQIIRPTLDLHTGK